MPPNQLKNKSEPRQYGAGKDVAVIVAVSKNGVIGHNNTLPWRLSADLKWFKQCTTGHTIIMGRKTYESIGKPLPNRENIVLTRQQGIDIPGCLVFGDIDTAVASATGPRVFVIGGAEIYRQALPRATHLYLTVVNAHVEGDTWLPFIDLNDWTLLSTDSHKADEKNQYDCDFRIYHKKTRLT